MHSRVEVNRSVRDLIWKLERKQVFVSQFGSAQKFLEWSLENANEWFIKYPNKELKRHVDL